MTAGPVKPSPKMMPKRINRIPPASSTPEERRYAFSSEFPQRGQPDYLVYADTGILLCISGRMSCIRHFTNHYGDRLAIAYSIEDEIRGLAQPASAHSKDARAHSAANTAVAHILNPNKIRIDSSEDYDASLFDEVQRQLRERAEAKGKIVDPRAHAGEAVSITLCVDQVSKGSNVVFLTNDGDASLVAKNHRIPVRHFGHVLMELVCAGHYTSIDDAYDALSYAQQYSSIPYEDVPANADALACLSLNDVCRSCNLLTRPASAPGRR